MAAKATSPVSFRIDRQLKADLERIATADERSLSWMIESMLSQYVAAVRSGTTEGMVERVGRLSSLVTKQKRR